MAEGAGAGPRLAELLAAGRRFWEEVETGAEPSSGAPAVQDKVRQGLDALRQAAAMVAQLDLFSENEELEEIASADLKYLLLPALLGALTLKQVDLSKRLEHLESARAHFWRFLKLCRSYGLGSFNLPPASPPGEEDAGSPSSGGPAATQPNLVAMASSRQAKIESTGRPKLFELHEDENRSYILESNPTEMGLGYQNTSGPLGSAQESLSSVGRLSAVSELRIASRA